MNRWIVAVALALAATACSHTKEAQTAASPPPEGGAVAAAPAPSGGTCPMGIPGAQVAVTDTAEGAAVDFTTSPDKVAQLRQNVRDAVAARRAGQREAQAMHGQAATGEAVEPSSPTGETGTGAVGAAPPTTPMLGTESLEGMPGMVQGPPAKAAVEDTPDGARVVFSLLNPEAGATPAPADPAALERGRSAVRAGAERIQNTPCQSQPTGQ